MNGCYTGGERRVVELLENQSGKLLNEALVEGEDENIRKPHWSLRDFFFRPTIIGKYLFTIVKFGLVQYVSHFFPPRINFILFGSNIYLLDSSDDSEDSVCIPCTGVGNLWCLWKWGIQVVLRVCVHCKYVQLSITHCYVWFIKWDYRYPYITIVLNFSQMWALYCLVKFYNVTHERLQPIRPLAKFISFKAIVFATWWQGVGIALLCSFGVLPDQEKLQTGLQDFLICIEVCCFLT